MASGLLLNLVFTLLPLATCLLQGEWQPSRKAAQRNTAVEALKELEEQYGGNAGF